MLKLKGKIKSALSSLPSILLESCKIGFLDCLSAKATTLTSEISKSYSPFIFPNHPLKYNSGERAKVMQDALIEIT